MAVDHAECDALVCSPSLQEIVVVDVRIPSGDVRALRVECHVRSASIGHPLLLPMTFDVPQVNVLESAFMKYHPNLLRDLSFFSFSDRRKDDEIQKVPRRESDPGQPTSNKRKVDRI